MHMSDALVSPVVGGVMWVSALAIARSSAKKLEKEQSENLPLMGVAGAFVFAAQMINVAIPGTGSSGHLGGGLLLAALLGPEAAFLILFAVLFIQALFFADGGLLALGCNVMNMGFFPAFVAYPLLRKALSTKQSIPRLRIMTAAILAVELGAVGVVFETALSGLAALDWKPFLVAFLPIHLLIGILEGLVTVSIITFLVPIKSDLFPEHKPSVSTGKKWIGAIGLVIALAIAGIGSRYASAHPDGLEWALSKAQFTEATIPDIQTKLAPFPDYQSKTKTDESSSKAGLVGVLITLAALTGLTLFVKHRSSRSSSSP